MRITRKFLQLTRYTYPYGTERFLKTYLPNGAKKDKYGNYFYIIGENPTAMFTCHLDTVGTKRINVNHIFENNRIRTDGKSILGADDKAGMVVLLYMIEKMIPGLYYFFIGEEVGCVGSGKLSLDWFDFEFNYIDKVISFDRRGKNSIITHQWLGRGCSDIFASELANRLNSSGNGLNLELDDSGVFTDSAQFMDIIPECTNISVGYDYEHTTLEYQDIDFLRRLCKSVCAIDWETLPIERNSFDEEENDDDFDIEEDEDQEFSPELYSYFKVDGIVNKMYISKKVINTEIELIKLWLSQNGYDTRDVVWNGNTLHVFTMGLYEFIGNRVNLVSFIPELESVSLSDLKKEVLNDDYFLHTMM